jgi:hypothetical protein
VRVEKATVVREGNGNGVYRTTWNGDVYPENKVLEQYRDEGEGKRVWEYTLGIYKSVLGK